ncbi:MmcQ/YjbR family DNA-binding protein [Mucilaginibacter lacusdianchii]|uniref:MmcQ/YjbR family DNA-binding protein n=1 Tax=Mucilaginibacter lacusdianchii TaxID=2684211 RepID=UPI00131B9614|nr:MmcQ/YjbR family DNA-binding protein [Mucilaginibacter sp. JXJ CY 39]
MNVEELRDYCLLKRGVEESFPFDSETLVFKAGGKIFLLIGLSTGNRFNVKCNPERAVELREQFSEVQPGYHMNKVHWNTVYTDGTLNRKQLCDMIDHSYELIVKSLPKKVREEITGSNL